MIPFEKRYQSLIPNSANRPLSQGECQTPDGKRCTLCHAGRLDYQEELAFKKQAILAWWNELGLSQPLDSIVPSPFGRYFRTVTKRKAFHSGRSTQLGLIGVDAVKKSAYPISVSRCAVEPQNHAVVYRTVQEFLTRREEQEFAESLSYVIVRGDTNEVAVIFNVTDFPRSLQHPINALSRLLTQREPSVKSVFVYSGDERSDYYLGRPATGTEKASKIALRKIFGFSGLYHTVNGKRLFYSPLSFSQTNHSILNDFVCTVEGMLQLDREDHLLDLYCGYGLFSLTLADRIHSAMGVDIAMESIHEAESNAQRLKIMHTRFVKNDITAEAIERLLRRGGAPRGHHLKIILDPPRNGTRPGVIEAIATSSAQRIVHIFCNTEIVKQELDIWSAQGYRVDRAVTVDMFPGTNEIETVVALTRTKA
jgi:tRNA/tmRNA/rRNA uracil-C5-methylase (TrmA/RlmC/RlmD family)